MTVQSLIRGMFLALAMALPSVAAQTPPRLLSLREAEAIAVRNHPRLASADLSAQAAGAIVREARAPLFPVLSGSLTGVGAEHDATLSSGAVPTSSLYSRAATGIVASQLLTDFGRTARLEESAKLRASAQRQNVTNTRAEILLEVRESYYRALATESVLKVVQETVDLRQVTLRQVTALAQSALRSTLDVSFAQVNVSQAQLALFRAESDAEASHARLSAALGYEGDQPFGLADEPEPPALEPDPDPLISSAMQNRPDLAALRLNRDAEQKFAEAEKKLSYPTIAAAAVAGAAPERDERLRETYGAAGLLINIPVLNGGLFSARHAEAEFRSQAAGKDVDDLSIQIARDVRIAWLNANDAFKELGLTAQLVDQANQTLRLAQVRYDAGLGGIIELTQAQLNQTSAQITAADAKYEYLERRSELDYALGSVQ